MFLTSLGFVLREPLVCAHSLTLMNLMKVVVFVAHCFKTLSAFSNPSQDPSGQRGPEWVVPNESPSAGKVPFGRISKHGL